MLDENISPRVAQALREAGWDVFSVRDLGLLEAPDHVVLERAFSDDRVLVTKNVGDFEALARAREIHAGIVLLEDGDLDRTAQLRLILEVLRALESERDLVNRIVRVAEDETLAIESLPET